MGSGDGAAFYNVMRSTWKRRWRCFYNVMCSTWKRRWRCFHNVIRLPLLLYRVYIVRTVLPSCYVELIRPNDSPSVYNIYFRESELTFLSRTDALSLLRPTERQSMYSFRHLALTSVVMLRTGTALQTTTDTPLLLRPRSLRHCCKNYLKKRLQKSSWKNHSEARSARVMPRRPIRRLLCKWLAACAQPLVHTSY